MAAGPATSRPTKRRSNGRKHFSTPELADAADRLDPLSVRVLEEGRRIILGKILADRRRAIILAAGFDAQAMKGFDRLARHEDESCGRKLSQSLLEPNTRSEVMCPFYGSGDHASHN